MPGHDGKGRAKGHARRFAHPAPGGIGTRREAIEPIDKPGERPDRRSVVLDDQARRAPEERLEPFGLDRRELRLLGFTPLPPGLADDLADALRRQPLPPGDLGNLIAVAQPRENPRPPRPLTFSPSRRLGVRRIVPVIPVSVAAPAPLWLT